MDAGERVVGKGWTKGPVITGDSLAEGFPINSHNQHASLPCFLLFYCLCFSLWGTLLSSEFFQLWWLCLTGGEGPWKQVGTCQEHWKDRIHLPGMFPLDIFQAHVWCPWHMFHECDHQPQVSNISYVFCNVPDFISEQQPIITFPSQLKCPHHVSPHSIRVTSLFVIHSQLLCLMLTMAMR